MTALILSLLGLAVAFVLCAILAAPFLPREDDQ